MHPRSNSFQVYFLVTLAFLIIAAIFLQTINQEIHLSTKGGFHVFASQYTAVAISSLQHHLQGLLGYNNISQLLLEYGTIDENILKQALSLKDFSAGGVFNIRTMDIGYCSFAWLAFWLFGYHVASFLYLYFVILIVSVTAFIIEFKKNIPALFTMVIFLLSLYLIGLSAVNIPDNVGAIYSGRFISLLAILPMLHIILFIFFEKPLNLKTPIPFLLLTIQSAIILWMQFIRLSVQWFYISLVALFVLNIFLAWRAKNQAKKINFKNRQFPILLFFVFLFLSKFIISYSIDDSYKNPSEGAHLFWHSIYVGLALHPEIRKEYTDERPVEQKEGHSWVKYSNYRPSDQDAYTATLKWLYERGKSHYSVFKFTQNDRVEYFSFFTFFENKPELKEINDNHFSRKMNFLEDYNWNAHEKILKEVVLSIIKKHPLKVIETAFIIKPIKTFIIFIRYFTNMQKPIKFWFSIESILLIIALCITAIFLRNLHEEFRSLLTPLSFIILFSLLTPIIAYPEPWTIIDSGLLLTMAAYIVFCIIFMIFLGFLRRIMKL